MKNNVVDISSLMLDVAPITPKHTVNEVGDLLLAPQYKALLSLPVVFEDKPVGIVSRYQMMDIFLKLYGRDVYGKQPIERFMNPKPLVVGVEQSLETASQYITDNITFPITEDFIVVDSGAYKGLGVVLDLLKAMEQQLNRRTHELAKAYNALKSSQAQLVQSEKMASLGQMVAGVAHEINTPLGYVRNNIEMTQSFLEQARALALAYNESLALMSASEVDEVALSQQMSQVEELGQIFTSDELFEETRSLFTDSLYGIDQIAELVRNLKDFSRLDQAKVANISLNDCLDSSLVIAKNILKNKVTVQKQYGDIPKIECSPSQINQVFLNLITNACQAIEGTGVILLKTFADEQFVHASVQDNGKGIAKEVIARIFDPFFTTKPIGQGTGLGLSISYQIIQKHGGKIKVASEVGKGTKFTISLPRSVQAVADKAIH